VKRILWVGESPARDTGLGRLSRELLGRLSKHFDAACLACHHNERDWAPEGAPYRLYPPGGDGTGRGALGPAASDFRPDVIVAAGDPWMIDWVFDAPLGLPTVGYLTLDGRPLHQRWQELMGRMSHTVVCSSFAESVVREAGVPVPVSVVPLGVNPAVFRPLPRDALTRVPRALLDRFVVGFVGRNQPRKQIPILVEAFAEFARGKEDAFLYLHASCRDVGWDLPALLDRFALRGKAGFPRDLMPAQGVADEVLAQVYSLFSILALPSTSEGFGLPILEGMACGTPVVATNYSAMVELVDGRGELIRVRHWANVGPFNVDQAIADVDHLVELLHKLYDNPDLRAEYGRKGREFAETMTWDRCAGQWAKLLEEVLSEAPGHRDREGTAQIAAVAAAPEEAQEQRAAEVAQDRPWPPAPALPRQGEGDGKKRRGGLRIAVVSTFDYPCGIGVYSEGLVREWRRQGHEVWCLGEQVPAGELRGEFPAEQTVRCWRRGGSFREAAEAVRRLQPDVVNIQHELSFCWDAREWEALLQHVRAVCPVVVAYHTLPKEREAVTRSRRPDAVILTNPHAYEAALREGWTTDQVWFIPHATARPLSPPPEEINHRVVTWGLMGSGKGYGECLGALKLLLREFPDASLTIHAALVPAKWAEQTRFLEEHLMPGVWERGLDTRVHVLLGWPPEAELQALIAQHSAGWLMYHHFDSAWCASAGLQMGWSACRPVIASWAHHFDVTPELHPLVQHTDRAEEIASGTAALWRDPDAYHALCRRIREHAEARGPGELAGDYLRVFEAALGLSGWEARRGPDYQAGDAAGALAAGAAPRRHAGAAAGEVAAAA